jgi:hypothetical protein
VGEYSQTPGKLNVVFNRGDEVGIQLDFDIDTTGYSWSASVVSLVDGVTIIEPAVTIVNAATGRINVAATEVQTAAMATGTYRVKLVGIAPGSVQRRYAEGLWEVVP